MTDSDLLELAAYVDDVCRDPRVYVNREDYNCVLQHIKGVAVGYTLAKGGVIYSRHIISDFQRWLSLTHGILIAYFTTSEEIMLWIGGQLNIDNAIHCLSHEFLRFTNDRISPLSQLATTAE